MTRIFGLCPRCKGRIRINDAERLNGRKIACRDCGEKIRIRVPQSTGGGDSEELAVFDLDESALPEDGDAESFALADDEYAAPIDDDLPVYRPQLKRTKKQGESTFNENGAAPSSIKKQTAGGNGQPKQSPLVIILACSGALVLAGGVVGGILLLRGGGPLKPAKFEPPEKYVAMQPGIVPLSGEIPEGWKASYGGGIGGIRIYARISDGGSISIDIRETEGSSAKGKMKKAIASGQEIGSFGSKTERIGDAPAIAATHEYHRTVVIKNFSTYKEGPARPIETKGFGEGRISDFTGKEGMFTSTIQGCRASVVHREHQYSIVCTCPPAQFKEVLPVFERIIASLGPGEKE
jgi:hypothetical protein